MLLLASLSITNVVHALPLNDELLRLFSLGITTGIFYLVCEEEYQRIRFRRHCPLMFAHLRLLLPQRYREHVLCQRQAFPFGDIVANLRTFGISLYAAYHLEKYYR